MGCSGRQGSASKGLVQLAKLADIEKVWIFPNERGATEEGPVLALESSWLPLGEWIKVSS